MKKFLLTCLFTLFILIAKPETSNADAGTLREAIEKANANGISEMDCVHFNLPDFELGGENDNIITEFPGLSSYITINGTYNGGKLPAGTYYYVIELKTDCPAIVGGSTYYYSVKIMTESYLYPIKFLLWK